MTDQVFGDTDFVVIERGPLLGVSPTVTFYPTKSLAKAYVDTRRGFFEHIDVCRVLVRLSTTMVPQETLEGEALDS